MDMTVCLSKTCKASGSCGRHKDDPTVKRQMDPQFQAVCDFSYGEQIETCSARIEPLDAE
jgi:hypothetical protein